MGYHIDSHDMCFGIQLADSRGDIGVIYAKGLMHVLIFFSPLEILGHSMKLFGVILVRTLG